MSTVFPASNDIPGWSLASGPKTYRESQLYDYMDGAAEIPKSYDFRSLDSAKYHNGITTLDIGVFDMGSPADAFGYYSARVFLEHSPRAKERIVQLDHEAHIYSTVGVLTFWKDRYTVILQPDEGKAADEALLKFARFISSRIPGKGAEPAMLHELPEAGQVENSARYVKGKAAFDATVMFLPRDVLSLSSGAASAAAEYSFPGYICTLAIIRYASSAEADEARSKLHDTLLERKPEVGQSASQGAFVFLTTGRAKGLGAITHGSDLLLAIGAPSVQAADKALSKLISSKK